MLEQGKSTIMSEDDILNAVREYLNERIYDCAILIDGEWGSGKTFFVKDKIINKIADKQFIYVSLYGVKNTQDVTKQIYVLSNLDLKGKALHAGNTVLTLFSSVFSFSANGLNIDLDSITTESFMKRIDISDKVLVFDDLERCYIPIGEILGYINTFVEHNHMKVIIIANQKEIAIRKHEENQELKYLIATKDINVDDNPELKEIFKSPDSNPKSQKMDEKPQLTLQDLNERKDKIFHTLTSYDRVKEKLIGQVYYYIPDLHSVLNTLIEEMVEDQTTKYSYDCELLKKLLKTHLNYFSMIMERDGHRNIRTFQFFLSKIKSLFVKMGEVDKSFEYFKSIIESCFDSCITFKAGEKGIEWEKEQQYSISSNSEYKYRFRFIDDFIVNGVMDKSIISKMYKVYLKDKRKNKCDDYIYSLECWFRYDDKTVIDNYNSLIKSIESLKIDMYPRLIAVALKLEDVSLFKKENIKQLMDTLIETAKKKPVGNIISNYYKPEINDEAKIKEYENYIKRLNEILENSPYHSLLKDYIDDNDNGWGEKLYRKMNQYKMEGKVYPLLYDIDIRKLAKKLIDSNEKSLYYFMNVIVDTYSGAFGGVDMNTGSNIYIDIDALNKLNSWLDYEFEKSKEKGVIWNYNFKRLIEKIDDLSSIYDNYIGETEE